MLGEKHAMLKKIWKGFSWIEIASVFLLLSVVLALTLPNFSRFECLAKQSEAKFQLMRILAAAQLFKSEYSRYPNLKELIDSERIKLRQQNYLYEITNSDDGLNLYVMARGRPGTQVANDQWRVDINKKLENLQNSCTR